MGEASDSAKGQVGQLASRIASDSLESAKNVGTKVAERAQEAMKEEGLAPGALTEAARSLGEGVQQGISGGTGSARGADPTGGTGQTSTAGRVAGAGQTQDSGPTTAPTTLAGPPSAESGPQEGTWPRRE